jgi:hypothetical protein
MHGCNGNDFEVCGYNTSKVQSQKEAKPASHLQEQFRAREAIGTYSAALEAAKESLAAVRDAIADRESKKVIGGVLDGSLPVGQAAILLSGPNRIFIRAGTIEAWTTGDCNILNSDLLRRLNAAQEEISRGDKSRVEVMIVITK